MAIARCTGCGNDQWYRKIRGARVKALLCTVCGGQLRGLTREETHAAWAKKREAWDRNCKTGTADPH